MLSALQQIANNYESVLGRIETACDRAGRAAKSVTLVAVTKYAAFEWIEALLELGHNELGESRPQQLVERAGKLSADVNWHLIGQLQRNKVRPVLPVTRLIHSVDSLRLLRRIDLLASETQLTPHLLLEVNVSGEEQKNGFASSELTAAWNEILEFDNVRVDGLMTMAVRSDRSEDARRVFSGLRELRDQLVALNSTCSLPQLSMGMSGDFEIAIEEGATLLRVGRTLFDGLKRPENL
jgi:pyridoxal phosphate enzyme (YggS family)